MLIISAGMPRAGTGWIYNMTNDLLVATGHDDARDVRERFRLQEVLRFHNCSIGAMNRRQALRLLLPLALRRTFVVKTHQPPTPWMQRYERWRLARLTYIYRDPRDVAVSALDRGAKMRRKGKHHTFARFHNVDELLPALTDWCRAWERWAAYPPVHMLRYETLKSDTRSELQRLAAFLELNDSDGAVDGVLRRYTSEADAERMIKYAHKNKAIVGRYRDVLSREEIGRIEAELGSLIQRMGYSLDA